MAVLGWEWKHAIAQVHAGWTGWASTFSPYGKRKLGLNGQPDPRVMRNCPGGFQSREDYDGAWGSQSVVSAIRFTVCA